MSESKVTVTLVLYPELRGDEKKEFYSQSIDVAKVDDEVSVIMYKWGKAIGDRHYAHFFLTNEETQIFINGLQEAMKDEPKKYFE